MASIVSAAFRLVWRARCFLLHIAFSYVLFGRSLWLFLYPSTPRGLYCLSCSCTYPNRTVLLDGLSFTLMTVRDMIIFLLHFTHLLIFPFPYVTFEFLHRFYRMFLPHMPLRSGLRSDIDRHWVAGRGRLAFGQQRSRV